MLRNGGHVCDWCGVYLHYRPHAVVLTVDGYVIKRVVLCVTHRDELKDRMRADWEAIEGERKAQATTHA